MRVQTVKFNSTVYRKRENMNVKITPMTASGFAAFVNGSLPIRQLIATTSHCATLTRNSRRRDNYKNKIKILKSFLSVYSANFKCEEMYAFT